ncbi:MAG: hypothetical protein OYH77_06205 [Pseudomonadota bacterium]|nr:hypothetical protein [Pseudomonadota bacterium]
MSMFNSTAAKFAVALCLCVSLWFASAFALAKARPHRKATETEAVVMKKLYPKKRKVEFAFNFGALVNQSYIETLEFNGGLSYYFNEHWGMLAEGSYGLSFDKSDRFCLEHFINKTIDGKRQLAASCAYTPGDLKIIKPKLANNREHLNFGPAYVPIVQIEKTAMAGVVWTPIYGKQIFTFLPRTSHLDFYLSGIAGVAIGKFFTSEEKLKNGNQARFTTDAKTLTGYGAEPADTDSYGEAGRPDPKEFYAPAIALSIGQKYHLARWLFLRIEARNYAVFAVHDVIYHSVFAVRGGFGVIL